MIRGIWTASGWATCVVSGFCLAAPVSWAQDAAWLAAPGTNNFNTGANWSTGTVPTGTATFDTTATTTVVFGTPVTTLGGFTFNAGAPNYTFTTSGNQALAFNGAGIVNNSATAPTFSINGANGMNFSNSSSAGNATITVNAAGADLQFSGTSTAGSATITIGSGAQTQFLSNATGGQARFVINPGGVFTMSGVTSGMTAGSIEGGGSYFLGSNQFTVGSNNLSTSVSGVIAGTGGSLVKVGTGTLALSGANTYTGGTTVSAGTLQLGASNSLASTGALTVNGGTFDLSGRNQTVGSFSGTGGAVTLGAGTLTVNQAADTTYAGAISGAGQLFKQGAGTLILSGINTAGGGTQITGGRLAVNGSLTGDVTIGSLGNLGGNGTITGNVLNGGIISPGNSIGALTISGTYTQSAGSFYQVEVNAAGQNDRINVTGAPGTATINGGTVTVLATPGNYARSTTYTILNATGGRTGTYSGVTSNFAFLSPTLTYDANNVFLTLLLTGFSGGGTTPNQRAVGSALDRGGVAASADLSAVLGVLSGLNTIQGPNALDQLGGEVYSGFATAALQSSRLFMNEVGAKMASTHQAGGAGGGSASAAADRLALTAACDVACDGERASPWSAWASALGNTGSALGDGNAHTVSYTIGGAAFGVDYRVDKQLLVGFAAGYTNATQSLDGLDGRGTSDGYQAAVYASFNDGAFYADGLAGYAYNDDRMRRTITFAGFTPRTAFGRTHADQFLGQIESGYRIMIYQPAAAALTPFLRLQGSSTTQAGFTESGADSIDLTVAARTTNSLRSIVGGQLSGEIDAGWATPLALQLRLGWAHEHVDDPRAVTASFVGAPGTDFTVVGAVPPRDSAILSLGAHTAVTKTASLYLRYDGDIDSSYSSHTLSAGMRLFW